MKKIIPLLFMFLSIGFIFTSCSNDDDTAGDGNTIAKVFEITDSFRYDSNLGWVINGFLNPRIYTTDHMVIYRLSGVTNSGKDVWQQIPRTLYLDLDGDGSTESELDYDYDFSIEDFNIYARGTYDLNLTPYLINNQTFRVVIIPGSTTGYNIKIGTVDYSDYNAVVKYYNINEKDIKQIILKK